MPATDVSAEHEEFSEAAKTAIVHLEVDPESVRVTDEYTSDHNGVTHVYLRQIEDGVDVTGADATVNVQDGIVVHSGSRFIDPQAVSGVQRLDEAAALDAALASVRADDAVVTGGPELVYRVLADRTARLAYDVQVQTPRHW